VFLCSIDFEKAFDKVGHEILIKILKMTGIDGKDIGLIANLYWHQTAEIQVEHQSRYQKRSATGLYSVTNAFQSLFGEESI